MAHLYKKIKKGHEYYYIRETQRVYGKPTTVNQVYLGTAEKVETLLGRGGFSPKEFGSVFILNELDKDLDLAGIVNGILPPKKRTKGPSLGELIFYAALNRAIAPTSKRQLAAWYETTDIQRIRPLRLESLNSQNFWNHWDRLSETDLEKIAAGFFRKVNSILPAQEKQLLIETTRLQAAPHSPGVLAEVWPEEDFAREAQAPAIGLELVSERQWGVPLGYQTFSGALSEEKFFERRLDDLSARVNYLGTPVKDITLLIHHEMDSEALVGRLKGQSGLHFIAASSLEAVPELSEIPLKDFSSLRGGVEHRRDLGEENERMLYYQTRGDFWGRSRRVIVTFDPKDFHESYQKLGKKVQKLRKELALLPPSPGEPGEDASQAASRVLSQWCRRLDLSPSLFQLSFASTDGRLKPVLRLNHRQMAAKVRHFGKHLLITDREDWGPEEVVETYHQRGSLSPRRLGVGANGPRPADGHESPLKMTLMPMYHWTGSKLRVHLLVSVVAMTYLTLLCQRLQEGGLHLTPREAMDELRSIRTAIYQDHREGKLRRMVAQVTDRQSAILLAMGFQVRDGKILPR
jgi:transposase